MNKSLKANATILLVIGGLVVFALGAGAGVFYQIQKQAKDPVIQKAIQIQPTVNILTSKTVQTIGAFGTVQKIDGRNITIAYGGDQITANIAADAQIFSSNPTKDPKTGNITTGIPQVVTLADIKVGDQLTVSLKILPNGQLQGDSVYILIPSQTK